MNDQTIMQLLEDAANQDGEAIGKLMTLHRARIRSMVSIRMGQELAQRVDPSDVVQETLIEATRRLPDYLEHQRVAFYPWLRGLAVNRLIQLHRQHVLADRRSLRREERVSMLLPDASQLTLAGRLVCSATSPSGQAERSEVRRRVREALEQLPEEERELLVLKYLEELSADEIAEVLGISQRTVWRCHGRAIERIGAILEDKR